MSLGNVIDLVSLIQTHGYGVLILATIIEGPVATAAGAFAASLGLMNLFFVILISFAGDIISDSFYFYVGKFGGKPAIAKYGPKFGLHKGRMKKIEKLLKKHFIKTLFVMKITPMLAPPGLIMIGASKVSFKRLLFSCLLIIIPASLFYALMGYYLGLAMISFFKYFKMAREIILLLLILVILVAYLIENKIFSKLGRRIERL